LIGDVNYLISSKEIQSQYLLINLKKTVK